MPRRFMYNRHLPGFLGYAPHGVCLCLIFQPGFPGGFICQFNTHGVSMPTFYGCAYLIEEVC